MAAPNDEALAGGTAQGSEVNPNNNAASLPEAERKRFEHLRAVLALRDGHTVHRLAEGGYLVAWKAWTRECADLAELEAHARRVGAMQ